MPYSRRSRFRHAERSAVRRGERVRTVVTRTGHRIRVAFGRAGSRVLSVLHPKDERRGMDRSLYMGPVDNPRNVPRADPVHRHSHREPSHHVGPCDEACRRADRVHGHRYGY